MAIERVGVLIPARMASSRLPGKMMAEVAGKPVIWHVIQRCKQAAIPSKIVLCTTRNKEDDVLCEVAEEANIEVYRGHATDVPARLLAAALTYPFDFIVIAEGDEVFVEATYIDAMAIMAHNSNNGFIKTNGLPLGAWLLGARIKVLADYWANHETDNISGWSKQLCDWCSEVGNIYPWSQDKIFWVIRLTLDYPADLDLMRAIYDELYQGKPIRLSEAYTLIRKKPVLADLNQHIGSE